MWTLERIPYTFVHVLVGAVSDPLIRVMPEMAGERPSLACWVSKKVRGVQWRADTPCAVGDGAQAWWLGIASLQQMDRSTHRQPH